MAVKKISISLREEVYQELLAMADGKPLSRVISDLILKDTIPGRESQELAGSSSRTDEPQDDRITTIQTRIDILEHDVLNLISSVYLEEDELPEIDERIRAVLNSFNDRISRLEQTENRDSNPPSPVTEQ